MKWDIISKVNGAGTTIHFNNYEINDYNVSNRTTYYQLNQVDYDGKSTRSNIISSYCNDQINNSLSIYPNPTNGNLTIDFYNQEFENDAIIYFIDEQGRVVFDFDVKLDSEYNSIKLSQLPVSKGVYTVYISDGKRETDKVKVVFL